MSLTRRVGNHLGSAISSLESAVRLLEGHSRSRRRIRSASGVTALRDALRHLTRVSRSLPRARTYEEDEMPLDDLVAYLERESLRLASRLLRLKGSLAMQGEQTTERLERVETALEHLGHAQEVLTFQDEATSPESDLENSVSHLVREVREGLVEMADKLENTRDSEFSLIGPAKESVERALAALRRGGFSSPTSGKRVNHV